MGKLTIRETKDTDGQRWWDVYDGPDCWLEFNPRKMTRTEEVALHREVREQNREAVEARWREL
jgi:hypothetical protein